MHWTTFLGIAFLFLVITACESSKKSSHKGSKEKQSSAVTQDTLPPHPSPIPPAPAPGTVRLKAKIVDMHEGQDNAKIVDLYVIRTLAYGASTPAIAVKDTMYILTKETNGLIKGDVILGTLKYRESMKGAQKPYSNWQLVSFSNDKN